MNANELVPIWDSTPQIHILFLKKEGKKSAWHFHIYLIECSLQLFQLNFIILILQIRELRLRGGK